jgi:hypothetical protein
MTACVFTPHDLKQIEIRINKRYQNKLDAHARTFNQNNLTNRKIRNVAIRKNTPRGVGPIDKDEHVAWDQKIEEVLTSHTTQAEN